MHFLFCHILEAVCLILKKDPCRMTFPFTFADANNFGILCRKLLHLAILAIQFIPFGIRHHHTHGDAFSHARRDHAIIFKEIQAAVDAIIPAVGKLDHDRNVDLADAKPAFIIARQLAVDFRFDILDLQFGFLQTEQQAGAEAIADGNSQQA
jgi:hypothetical protein